MELKEKLISSFMALKSASMFTLNFMMHAIKNFENKGFQPKKLGNTPR
jgi:hypothetical protein